MATHIPVYTAPTSGPLKDANATTVVHHAAHGLEVLGRERVLMAQRAFGPDGSSTWRGCYLARAYGAMSALWERMFGTGNLEPLTALCDPVSVAARALGLTVTQAHAIVHLYDTQRHVLVALTDAYLDATAPKPDREAAEALLATLKGDDATITLPSRFPVPVVLDAEVAIDVTPNADSALALAD